jgi:hypothetical protein
MAIHLGTMVTLTILVETVFRYEGLGRLVFDAIRYRDYPTLQGCVLLLTLMVVTANFLANLAYRPSRSAGGDVSALRSGLALAGGGLVALLVVAALLAPVIAPYAPDVPSGPSYASPSLDHPVGTNNLGQDMLPLIWGARASLTVAVAVATLALAIGGLVGMAAGLVGGSSTRWRCASWTSCSRCRTCRCSCSSRHWPGRAR